MAGAAASSDEVLKLIGGQAVTGLVTKPEVPANQQARLELGAHATCTAGENKPQRPGPAMPSRLRNRKPSSLLHAIATTMP